MLMGDASQEILKTREKSGSLGIRASAIFCLMTLKAHVVVEDHLKNLAYRHCDWSHNGTKSLN